MSSINCGAVITMGGKDRSDLNISMWGVLNCDCTDVVELELELEPKT